MRQKILDTSIGYLLLLFGFCAIIPHAILCLLQIESVSAIFSPFELENYANFFVCQWMPFWMTFIPYLRLQKLNHFSWLPAICTVVIVLTYLPGFEKDSVMTIALVIPLVFSMELSGLLNKAVSSRSRFFSAIAADRGMLRAFYYWSVVFLCGVLISCDACTFERTVVSPFQMLPIPGVLLFAVLRHQQRPAPAIWSMVGMLPAIPLSLFLVTIGPMEPFKQYHIMSLGIGYVLLFLLLIVYNVDYWKSKLMNSFKWHNY